MSDGKNTSYISDGKGLKVHKLAYEPATDLHRVHRASRSVCVNSVEGFDRQNYSKPEFRRFFMMAPSLFAEVSAWLDFSLTFKGVTTGQHKKLATDRDHANRVLHRLRVKVDWMCQRIFNSRFTLISIRDSSCPV